MRVLFPTAPAIGHTFPMVPLAWAFRAAGHEAVFVTGGDGLTVARAGLPVVDALPGRSTTEMLSGFARDVPALFAPLSGTTLPEMHAEMDQRKPHIIGAWDLLVDAYVAAAERVRPDLVVHDPILGVGPLIAAKAGVPAVGHGIGLSRFGPELLHEPPAARAFQRHGVRPPDGVRTLDIAPPSLAEGPPSPLAMRYVPYNGATVLPDWLAEPPSRPRIAVTIGSMVPRVGGLGPVERLLAAAPGVDAEFVVALGDTDPEQAGRLPEPDEVPPNVRTAAWVPLDALLPTCTAAIHHGGAGTLMTCCTLGVPQLVLPLSPDRHLEAEMLRARGACHITSPDGLDADAVKRLLADDQARTAAAELRAEIAALPTPSAVVAGLTG